jgi:hypothetical protein
MARTCYLVSLIDEFENDEYDFDKEEDFEEAQSTLVAKALLQAFARTQAREEQGTKQQVERGREEAQEGRQYPQGSRQ